MRYFLLPIFLLCPVILFAQDLAPDTTMETESTKKEVIEKLTYQQQPGLAVAASKIFFSKKRYSISGFGEVNYVWFNGEKDRTTGDLELYYTNLYRAATFLGYRLHKKVIWNSELQLEFLHDGKRETHYEFIFEAFMDFLFKDYLKARVGFYPLTIGYVNNNDEPVMFYSVNRSEVERIIIPSTWIEFGTMLYGNITQNLSYAVSLSQGLEGAQFIGSTWIRQGRTIRFGQPRGWAVNPQINYTGIPGFTASLSGYFGTTGQGEQIQTPLGNETVKAPVQLYSGYLRYDWKNLRFVSVGTLGKLGETESIYELTAKHQGNPQVAGSQTYGFLLETGWDMLYHFKKIKSRPQKKNFLFDNHELKLPIFVRYERLNTHQKVAPSFENIDFPVSNLHIVTAGINFNLRENLVLKSNYQFRTNLLSLTVN